MRSALSVAIAALLVSSLLPVAIVASAAAPGGAASVAGSTDSAAGGPSAATHAAVQADSDETTTRLGLDGSSTSAYAEPGPDLGTTLAAAGDELRRERSIHELESAWPDLSDAERREQIEAYEDRIMDRIAALGEREQAITDAMVAGDASASRVLRTLARNDHEASVLASNLNRLRSFANEVPNFTIDTRSTMGAIETHEGPVRDSAFRTVSASDSTGASSVVLVEAADSGVVVSTTTGGAYLREATRHDNRDPSLPVQIDSSDEWDDRLSEVYPWVRGLPQDEISSKTKIQYPPTQHFTYDIRHVQGRLLAHLDGGTTDVFRENQELWLDSLPVESAGTWTGDSVTVSMNATPRSGPVQFTVTDTATGNPRNATILVDGQPISETGSDGSTWAVHPMDGVEFTVRTETESITVAPDR